MTHLKLTEFTKLSSLSLPYLDVILDEVFLVPNPKRIINIKDLAITSKLNIDDTIRRLRELYTLSQNLDYSHETILKLSSKAQKTLYIEASSTKQTPMHHFKPLKYLWSSDFKIILQEIKNDKTLSIIICPNGKRSFSAAMYLRNLGYSNLFILKNGYESLQKA